MGVRGGWAFSYKRGTPVNGDPHNRDAPRAEQEYRTALQIDASQLAGLSGLALLLADVAARDPGAQGAAGRLEVSKYSDNNVASKSPNSQHLFPGVLKILRCISQPG